MSVSEVLQFVATAAASGIIGNRMDAAVVALGPAQKLHAWFRARLIDPAIVLPSPTIASWIDMLSDVDREELGKLLREAVSATPGTVTGSITVRDNYGQVSSSVIGSQYNFGVSRSDAGWEYASINYGKEADFDRTGHMKWVAYITWPGASRLDVRDHVRMPDLLNELGKDGWELVSERPTLGINTTEYTLRRERR